MDLWNTFWSALTGFVAAHGLAAVAVIVMLKAAGVPVPIPGDLLMVMVGAQASAIQQPLLTPWLVLALATIAGASVLYLFARWLGEDDIVRYGHYVGLNPQRIEKAEQRLRAGGTRAILSARIVPGLRLAIVVVCGIVRTSRGQFFAATTIAAFMYVGACLVVGYLMGDVVLENAGDLVIPLGLLEPLIVLAILFVWLRRSRRRMSPADTTAPLSRTHRVRAGAFAGALAASGTGSVISVILYSGGPFLGQLLDASDVGVMVGRLGGLSSLLATLLAAMLLGVGWGIVYGVVDPRWATEWPDALRGVLFAPLPLAAGVLVQLLSNLIAGQNAGEWLVELFGEAVRWATYGLLLGLIYPVLRAHRVRPKDTASEPAQPLLVAESRPE